MPGKRGPSGPRVEEDGSIRVGQNKVRDAETGKVRRIRQPRWDPKRKRWVS